MRYLDWLLGRKGVLQDTNEGEVHPVAPASPQVQPPLITPLRILSPFALGLIKSIAADASDWIEVPPPDVGLYSVVPYEFTSSLDRRRRAFRHVSTSLTIIYGEFSYGGCGSSGRQEGRSAYVLGSTRLGPIDRAELANAVYEHLVSVLRAAAQAKAEKALEPAVRHFEALVSNPATNPTI